VTIAGDSDGAAAVATPHAGGGSCGPRLWSADGALIVGYGNTLRSDDGLGWHAAARLADEPRLRGAQVLWQHQLTPELAVDISKASLVVFIDASEADEAGAVSVRRLDSTPGAGSAWSHHVAPEALVALARELWHASPVVFLVSVGAASLGVGDRLSPEVERALPAVVDAVVAIVEEHCHS
jgi:hydrogenase maturation protease